MFIETEDTAMPSGTGGTVSRSIVCDSIRSISASTCAISCSA
jgi:hypothetical protein